MTFGAWWILLENYKYGITYDLANKVIKYIQKSQNNTPTSINLQLQDQILSYAYYNEYGMPKEDCGYIPVECNQEGSYSEYGF